MNEYEPGSLRSTIKLCPIRISMSSLLENSGQEKERFLLRPQIMPACAEARYFGYDAIDENTVVPVKGKFLNEAGILDNEELAKDFVGGPLLIARLCPVDYHRYHYMDAAKR